MGSDDSLVVVFPVSTTVFGIREDWLDLLAPKFTGPAYLLIILLLVVWVAITVLRRFEDADFERKLWNIPVLLVLVAFWPSVIAGLSELVNVFNTFLVTNVFGFQWKGFGFPAMGSFRDLAIWPTEGLARLLPNLAYWTIYAFFLVFFFFYAIMGPLVLAKGVLFDEVDSFLEVAREMTLLLLWQTTLVILVAFIMPEIVSGRPLPSPPEANFYFLSVILGIMIFFVPPLTRKFGRHLGSAFVPLGFRWGGAMLGLGTAAKLGGTAFRAAGLPLYQLRRFEPWVERGLAIEEFHARYAHRREVQELEERQSEMRAGIREEHHMEEEGLEQIFENRREGTGLIRLGRRAKQET